MKHPVLRRIATWSGALLLVALFTYQLNEWSRAGSLAAVAAENEEPLMGTVNAPSFPPDLDWLNTGGEALSLEQLRGKVVLLDFWTYGCINCIHIIPDLKRLEAKYGDALVVIGVHSAKFAQEGKTDSIRKLVLRYDLAHPVVNDRDYQIWRAYNARAWPTLVLIDPAGKVVGTLAGEGHYDTLDRAIGRLIDTFAASDQIDRTPLALERATLALADRDLLFPGKVLADGEGQRLFISDTNHHRIVVTDLDGQVLQVIGDGEKGLRDGPADQARFHLPQGLTLADADTLYVADTENHVIRRVDLAAATVSTVAGTGEQVYQRASGGPARTTGLNSPWDVLAHDGLVYIAMAGQHQIWVYDPEAEEVEEFAGSRREELRDGPRLRAGLNQPSGLAVADNILFVADSEASAIRAVGLGRDGEIDTIVGTGLFDFGDVDGSGTTVRLQHPLGVAVWPGADGETRLVISDTYNDKIKLIDPAERSSFSLRGGDGSLDEPGGISILGNKAYIADTNHHAIRVLDLERKLLARFSLRDPDQLL